MTKQEITKLENIAENHRDKKTSSAAMVKLRAIDPTYHWCPDWDYMVICKNHEAYECCTCSKRKVIIITDNSNE